VVPEEAKGNDCVMDLDAVAGELYGLLPEEFAAARKMRAGEAQAEGERDLAAAVRQLRRPTTSAWLANLLVRERPTQIGELLELGTAMHRAQADLAGKEMRQLSHQRQAVVTSLSDAARRLAHDRGKRTSDATMRELEETLEAAIADSGARDALAAGHLAAAMRYSGLGAEWRGGATTPPQMGPTAARRGAATSPPLRRAGATADEAGAEKRLARAEREVAEHARRRQKASEDVDRCNRAIGEAEDVLRSLRGERSRAQAELLQAERALKAAERRADDAGGRSSGR